MIAEIAALYDPARAYRRVFGCEATGRFVKIYTKRTEQEFGRIVWLLTGSECDATGDALPLGEGHRVLVGPDGLPATHEVQHNLQSAVDAAQLLHTEREAFAQRVLEAAISFDGAAGVL